VVSSVLRNGLQINTLISCCKEMWVGGGWRAWGGGRGCEPAAILVLSINWRWWSARDGGFLTVIAAWGEGVNVRLCPPSPSSDRSSPPQNARKNTGAWIVKEIILYFLWKRAWWTFLRWLPPGGRGLMCACVPPPPRRIACWSPRMRVKTTMVGVLGHAPLYRARPRPPLRQIGKKTKQWGGPLAFTTHVCDSTQPLVMIG
jgi:hypothetical protein